LFSVASETDARFYYKRLQKWEEFHLHRFSKEFEHKMV
jgi:hypothetical protein